MRTQIGLRDVFGLGVLVVVFLLAYVLGHTPPLLVAILLVFWPLLGVAGDGTRRGARCVSRVLPWVAWPIRRVPHCRHADG